MSITKDYEGNEIIEDQQLKTKPTNREKTVDALVAFTKKGDGFLEELNGKLASDSSIVEGFRTQMQHLYKRLDEHVIGIVDQQIIDMYVQRVHQTDDADLQDLATLIVGPLTQKAYNDGTHQVYFDALKHSFLGSSLFAGVEGTQENPLVITIQCQGLEEVVGCRFTEVFIEGEFPARFYFDDKNAYFGEHDNIDALKQAATYETKDFMYIIDENGIVEEQINVGA